MKADEHLNDNGDQDIEEFTGPIVKTLRQNWNNHIANSQLAGKGGEPFFEWHW